MKVEVALHGCMTAIYLGNSSIRALVDMYNQVGPVRHVTSTGRLDKSYSLASTIEMEIGELK